MRRLALAVVMAAACAGGAQRVPAGEVRPVSAPAPAPASPAGVNAADVRFMSGMIAHHAQAVLIAGWAPTHGASAAVRTLCGRIIASQNDEIAFMQRWLEERQQPVPDAAAGHSMPGMDHAMLMPGMLTPDQLAQLDAARDGEFDRLFLTFMIQHHQGALTMVQQLLATPGAAQGVVFQFSAGVSADQSAEIDRMSRMLAALP